MLFDPEAQTFPPEPRTLALRHCIGAADVALHLPVGGDGLIELLYRSLQRCSMASCSPWSYWEPPIQPLHEKLFLLAIAQIDWGAWLGMQQQPVKQRLRICETAAASMWLLLLRMVDMNVRGVDAKRLIYRREPSMKRRCGCGLAQSGGRRCHCPCL